MKSRANPRVAAARTQKASPRRATAPDSRTAVRAAARIVDAPWELEQELRNDAHARDAYEAMPPSHRKSYVAFIEDATRPETRVRRVQQALRMMAQWSAEHTKKKPAKKK